MITTTDGATRPNSAGTGSSRSPLSAAGTLGAARGGAGRPPAGGPRAAGPTAPPPAAPPPPPTPPRRCALLCLPVIRLSFSRQDNTDGSGPLFPRLRGEGQGRASPATACREI